MNDANIKRVRALPLMLVLFVLAASVFSNLMQYGIGGMLKQWTSLASGVSSTIVLLVLHCMAVGCTES